MKLATIEKVDTVHMHPNAERLDIVTITGYSCIVPRDEFKLGEKVVFIFPDSVLPDVPWFEVFRKMSSRVKAVKLRGKWSEGIVLKLNHFPIPIDPKYAPVGFEVSELLGITHYEPPQPQDLAAKGYLPFGIPKTDEERFNNIESLPYGELVDIALKVDGQSASFYHKDNELGVCGRTMEYKLDADNHFTRNFRKLNLEEKLKSTGKNICFRGEQYGQGIQSNSNNPHSKLPVGVQFFSVWLIDERRYAYKGDPFYAFDLFPKIGLPTVPVLERDVILTPELIQKYAEELDKINGQPFEGVVIQHAKGSFKVLSKVYDSKK